MTYPSLALRTVPPDLACNPLPPGEREIRCAASASVNQRKVHPLPLCERAGRRGFSNAQPRVRGWKKIAPFAFAVLASIVFSAWAPKPPHVGIRSIGIIAAVGDTCMFEHATDKPFEWIGPPEASFLEISDWGIDDAATKAITAILLPRYHVQSIAIEHQYFDTWTWDSLSRRIRELPVPETPVDAYLLILRDWRGDEIGNSDHQLGGLGFYRRDFGGGRQRYGAFASFRLVVMEPDHGGIIASRAALLPNGHLPWMAVSPALWPRTQNDLTDAQRRTLQSDFLKLIDASLPIALQRLGLRTDGEEPARQFPRPLQGERIRERGPS